MRPQPGQYWRLRCGAVVYVIGVAPMLYLPIVCVDKFGTFHTCNIDGTAHRFLRNDSVADLVEHLPDYPGFPIPPDTYRVHNEKADEVTA